MGKFHPPATVGAGTSPTHERREIDVSNVQCLLINRNEYLVKTGDRSWAICREDGGWTAYVLPNGVRGDRQTANSGKGLNVHAPCAAGTAMSDFQPGDRGPYEYPACLRSGRTLVVKHCVGEDILAELCSSTMAIGELLSAAAAVLESRGCRPVSPTWSWTEVRNGSLDSDYVTTFVRDEALW